MKGERWNRSEHDVKVQTAQTADPTDRSMPVQFAAAPKKATKAKK